MEFQDYYELLGVPKDVSQPDLKKAFRRLARKYHPDVAEDKQAAEEKFKQINEAYEVLGDPEKRRKYDQLGANWDGRSGGFTPPPGFDFGGRGQGFAGFDFGGTGFSDFFEAFFGGGGGGSAGFGAPMGGGVPSPRRGSDIEGQIVVSLDEVNNGSVREITLSRPDGGGREKIKVRIPRGVAGGQRLRVSGRGNPGMAGGAPGDLYLAINLQRHPDFEVEGADLVHELELDVHQLVLGAMARVPVPGGSVKLRIPECSGPGDRLRLAGKGLALAGGGRGDLYVELAARFPERLDAGARQRWQALAAGSGKD
ncbi:MAG: DnaJ C-terminal domain-containing protein [Verrucomicrobiota bacterium]|nr:DnaJ C-terminal domain-containing protein [Verrucomicrobiota bacterium]